MTMSNINHAQTLSGLLQDEEHRYRAELDAIADSVQGPSIPLAVKAALGDARREHYTRRAAIRMSVGERMLVDE